MAGVPSNHAPPLPAHAGLYAQVLALLTGQGKPVRPSVLAGAGPLHCIPFTVGGCEAAPCDVQGSRPRDPLCQVCWGRGLIGDRAMLFARGGGGAERVRQNVV